MRTALVLVMAATAAALVDWRSVNQREARPDMDLAKNLLLSCYSNYCGSESNSTMQCYWCRQIPDVIDGTSVFLSRFGDANTGTSGMVVYNPTKQYAVVVWEGTSNVDGAVVDGTIAQVQIPGAPFGAKSHKGFYDGVMRASNQVYTLATQALRLCGPECRLIVTGHSLGASLAYVSAMNLARQTAGRVPMELYTFGAARVFNPAAAEWFKSLCAPRGPIITSFRFVNGGDIVTHVPPRNLFGLRYAHVGREVWLTEGTVRLAQDFDGEDVNGALSVEPLGVRFKDHNMYFGHFLNDGAKHRCLYTSQDKPWHIGGFDENTPAPAPVAPRPRFRW